MPSTEPPRPQPDRTPASADAGLDRPSHPMAASVVLVVGVTVLIVLLAVASVLA